MNLRRLQKFRRRISRGSAAAKVSDDCLHVHCPIMHQSVFTRYHALIHSSSFSSRTPSPSSSESLVFSIPSPSSSSFPSRTPSPSSSPSSSFLMPSPSRSSSSSVIPSPSLSLSSTSRSPSLSSSSSRASLIPSPSESACPQKAETRGLVIRRRLKTMNRDL